MARARGVKLGNPNGAASLRRAGKGGAPLRAAIAGNADRHAPTSHRCVERHARLRAREPRRYCRRDERPRHAHPPRRALAQVDGDQPAGAAGTADMRQSRLMSLVEAVANVVVGYGVAVVTQLLVFPLFGLRRRCTTTWHRRDLHESFACPQLRLSPAVRGAPRSALTLRCRRIRPPLARSVRVAPLTPIRNIGMRHLPRCSPNSANV